MNGNNLREKLSHEFHSKKDFEKTVEMMVKLTPENRGAKHVSELVKIVKQMKFFKETIVPLTDEDALQIAKRLKYLYVPKGQIVRKALERTDRFYYIMCGKVVCSFPQQ